MAVPWVVAMRHPARRFVLSQCQPRTENKKYFQEIMEYIGFLNILTTALLHWFLFQDDPEWCWVLRSDGHEGFVPAGFIYPLDAIQKQRRCQLPALRAIFKQSLI